MPKNDVYRRVDCGSRITIMDAKTHWCISELEKRENSLMDKWALKKVFEMADFGTAVHTCFLFLSSFDWRIGYLLLIVHLIKTTHRWMSDSKWKICFLSTFNVEAIYVWVLKKLIFFSHPSTRQKLTKLYRAFSFRPIYANRKLSIIINIGPMNYNGLL